MPGDPVLSALAGNLFYSAITLLGTTLLRFLYRQYRKHDANADYGFDPDASLSFPCVRIMFASYSINN